uniref:Uncharacterized protein n=1 Tax=Lactuca sativa TaxID=4236 RepID=A0A9R1XYB6_LACSA|nr:hypothetical protein LSAT_V11C100044910 [Lactuca sativa]
MLLKMWGLRNVGENVNVQEVYDLMMRELGYDGTEIMYYHFRLPNEGFNFGLRALEGGEKTMASGEVHKGKGVEGFADEFDAKKELNKEIDGNEELSMNKSNGQGVEGFADEGYRVVMDNDT